VAVRSDDSSSHSPDIFRPEDLPEGPAFPDPDFLPDREGWLERIVLPGKTRGIPLTVLAAFGLGVLSASLLGLFVLLLVLLPFTCGGTEGLARFVFVCGVPVHPAALAAGLLAGGARRDGAAAARLAVLSGALGTLLYAAVGVLWYTAQR
jgi:hypothetical protein